LLGEDSAGFFLLEAIVLQWAFDLPALFVGMIAGEESPEEQLVCGFLLLAL
jgi:hypothetical protein